MWQRICGALIQFGYLKHRYEYDVGFVVLWYSFAAKNHMNASGGCRIKMRVVPRIRKLTSDDLYLENDHYLLHTRAHGAIECASKLSSSNCKECE